MAVDLGWSEDRESAGFSAGWLASAVFIGRLFTAGAWGEFADKRGRRPALAITLTSMAIGNLLFGFCKSFWMAIAIRLIFLGVLNGYVTLMGILACEIAGKENQTRILAYVLGSSSLTQLLAPALAG